MAVHKSRRSILSLKSWLFTPATKADRFGRAAEVHADALIIDLEDAVAISDKQKARTAALQYLEQPAGSRLPGAVRIDAPTTRDWNRQNLATKRMNRQRRKQNDGNSQGNRQPRRSRCSG